MGDELDQVLALLAEIVPEHPADFVVLAIGVVVAELGVAHLVAGEDQWRALREQEAGEHILAQLTAQSENLRIVGRAFDAAIVAVVVAGAVAIILAIGLVVLLVVAEEVGERETVVHGDVVDAGARLASIMVEQVG